MNDPSLADDPLRASGGRGLSLLSFVLGLPWVAHALVVLGSGLGVAVLSRGAAIAIVLTAAAGAAWLATRASRPGGARWAEDVAAPRDGGPREDLDRRVTALANALSFAGLFALAGVVLLGLALPTVAYDALGYRLPVVAQWLDAGRVAWVTTDDPVRNGYPLGQEAESALLAAVSGSVRGGAAVVSALHVLAGALSVAWLARLCGVRPALSRAAAGAFLLVPMTLLNAPSGYVDAAFGGACVALFCLAAGFGVPGSSRPAVGVALGMAACHVLALKGTGIAFVAVTALSVVARELGVRRTSPRALALALCPAGLFALPGAFWAVRDVIHTGNPLWPVAVQALGRTWLPGVGTMEQVLDVRNNMPPELSRLHPALRVLVTWLPLHGPATDFDARLAGLGYAWPLFALPALASFVVRQVRDRTREERWSPASFVVLVTAICFALQPLKWWSRYTLWLWGAGALALAVQADRLWGAGRRRLLVAGLATYSALAVGEGAFSLAHAQGAALALRRWRERPALPLYDPRAPLNATSWIPDELWTLGVERDSDVCRGSWKPGTDDANLDGVFAQLSPRPRVHVLPDDDAAAWPRLSSEARALGCRELLLFTGSAVLPAASRDPDVSVRPSSAFDPLYVVRMSHP